MNRSPARSTQPLSKPPGAGHLGTASELFRRAIELTQDTSSVQAARRAIRFDECCVQGGGDPAEAREKLEAALSACREPELRAELRLHIATDSTLTSSKRWSGLAT